MNPAFSPIKISWRPAGVLIMSVALFFSLESTRGALSLPQVVVCDVGQGDAVLVRSAGRNLLIDTGPDDTVLQCLGDFLPWYDRTLDLLVLSHQDSDHIGGASAVLDRYVVRQVAWNGKSASSETYEKLKTQLDRHPSVRQVVQGDQWRWVGTQVSVVWPPGENIPEDQNQAAVGLLLRLGSFGFLTLGDLECTQELAVGGSILLNHWQIVKVSHHGSKTSTCEEIFARNQPEVALISVGKGNTYGHPEESVMARLQEAVPTVLRTDLHGPLELRLGHLEYRWR